MDYIVPGVLQARILEWVAFPFSRGSSWPRDQSLVSCIAGEFFLPAEPQGSPDLLHLTWYSYVNMKSTNVAANGIISLFLWLSNIPLYICYHIFFFHLFVARSGFHVLTIANSAAVNIGIYVTFWIRVFSGCKKWTQWHILFSWAQKSLQIVTSSMKLKSPCSLEEKLWQT